QACYKVAFFEPGKRLLEGDACLKMRSQLVMKAGLELIGVARPERAEPPRILELPPPLGRRIDLDVPSRKLIVARRQDHSWHNCKRLKQSLELWGIVEFDLLT